MDLRDVIRRMNRNPQGSRLQQEFQLRHLLGFGSFGAVIHCRNKLDRKDYAVKITTNVSDTREIQNLGKLPTHENLVQYHTSWKDLFSSGELSQFRTTFGIQLSTPQESSALSMLCIQMELCGQDLRSWLAQVQPFDEKISIKIFLQLLAGLNHIHTHNLIHRDLKPENIFFGKNNPSLVKIGDLGIATDHSAPKARLHTAGAGTMWYLAPEKAQASYNKSVDIYALGIIFMELLSPSLQRGGHCEKLIAAINDLKYKKIIPGSIEKMLPKAASLIVDMVAVDPRERPSCETICTAFPTWSSFIKRTQKNEDEKIKTVPSPQNSVVHSGVNCDGCGVRNIKGVRYNCTTCTDYDLCEKCEKIDGLHPEDHVLLKIKTYRGRENFGPDAADSFTMATTSSFDYYRNPFRGPHQDPFKFDNQQTPFRYDKHQTPSGDPVSAPFHRLNLNSVGQTRTYFDTNLDDSSSAEEADEEYVDGVVCNNCARTVKTWHQCDNCPKRYPGGLDFTVCGDCYHQNSFSENHCSHSRHSFTKFKI